MRRPAESGLIAASLLLAGCIGAELLWLRPGQVAVAPLRPAMLRLAPDQPVQAVMHVDEWMGTVLARPLFSADRRPPAGPSAQAGSTGTTLPRLSGVVIGAFGRTALFAAEDGGKPAAVKEGGVIGLFTVRKIAAEGVLVSGPDGQRSLRPHFDPGHKAAAETLRGDAPVPPILPEGAPAAEPSGTADAPAPAVPPETADAPGGNSSPDASGGSAAPDASANAASQDAINSQGQSPK
jgi:hypothetical protein